MSTPSLNTVDQGLKPSSAEFIPKNKPSIGQNLKVTPQQFIPNQNFGGNQATTLSNKTQLNQRIKQQIEPSKAIEILNLKSASFKSENTQSTPQKNLMLPPSSIRENRFDATYPQLSSEMNEKEPPRNCWNNSASKLFGTPNKSFTPENAIPTADQELNPSDKPLTHSAFKQELNSNAKSFVPVTTGDVSKYSDLWKNQGHTNAELIRLLNLMPSKYTVHYRLLRWMEALDFESIRNFKDRDENGDWELRYADLGEKELKLQYDEHTLSGIENIISFDQLINKYTLNYPVKNNRPDEGKFGKRLYATRITPDGFEPVLFEVAYSGDILYHAMWKPITENSEFWAVPLFDRVNISSCKALKKTLDETSSKFSRPLFDLPADGTLVMKILHKSVIFVFHPLKLR